MTYYGPLSDLHMILKSCILIRLQRIADRSNNVRVIIFENRLILKYRICYSNLR